RRWPAASPGCASADPLRPVRALARSHACRPSVSPCPDRALSGGDAVTRPAVVLSSGTSFRKRHTPVNSKVGKKTRFALSHLEEFFRLWSEWTDSDRSWTVSRETIEAKGFDLKAANPRAETDKDGRTTAELLGFIEAKGREVGEALAILRTG